jgi:hypothetical protein
MISHGGDTTDQLKQGTGIKLMYSVSVWGLIIGAVHPSSGDIGHGG